MESRFPSASVSLQLTYAQGDVEAPSAGGMVAAGCPVIRGLAEGGWAVTQHCLLFCAGSLNSLKQEGGLYRDKQLDAAIAWYLWCWGESTREAGELRATVATISNFLQAGEAHHTQRGTPSHHEPLSPGPAECRGEGVCPEPSNPALPPEPSPGARGRGFESHSLGLVSAEKALSFLKACDMHRRQAAGRGQKNQGG